MKAVVRGRVGFDACNLFAIQAELITLAVAVRIRGDVRGLQPDGRCGPWPVVCQNRTSRVVRDLRQEFLAIVGFELFLSNSIAIARFGCERSAQHRSSFRQLGAARIDREHTGFAVEVTGNISLLRFADRDQLVGNRPAQGALGTEVADAADREGRCDAARAEHDEQFRADRNADAHPATPLPIAGRQNRMPTPTANCSALVLSRWRYSMSARNLPKLCSRPAP